MARVHYFSFIADDNGQPIPGADVNIYLAGTETAAKIYDSEFGGIYNNTLPQVSTNTKGFFEFWVADAGDVNGYANGQKFKIEWEKVGVSSGYIDWIDVFPNILPVDETSFASNIKDKLLSNRLAFNWESHRNHNVKTDYFPIHGLEPIDIFPDYNMIDGVFSTSQEEINKVISNKLGYIWDNHSDFSFDDMTSITPSASGSVSPSASFSANQDIYNETAHGLLPAIFNNSDVYFNKLVSNALLQRYASVDGTQSFTNPVSGVYPTDNNHLVTKEYVLDAIGSETFIVSAGSWSVSGAEYVYELNHNLNSEYPSVTVWNSDTKRIETPSNVETVDVNNLKLFLSSDINTVIKVIR